MRSPPGLDRPGDVRTVYVDLTNVDKEGKDDVTMPPVGHTTGGIVIRAIISSVPVTRGAERRASCPNIMDREGRVEGNRGDKKQRKGEELQREVDTAMETVKELCRLVDANVNTKVEMKKIAKVLRRQIRELQDALDNRTSLTELVKTRKIVKKIHEIATLDNRLSLFLI